MKVRKRFTLAAGLLCAAVTAAVCCAGLTRSENAHGGALTIGTALSVTENRGGEYTALARGLLGSVRADGDIADDAVSRPRLAAGGRAFGIKLVTDGVMIVDMKRLSGVCPAGDAGLRVGDVIETINGENVRSNSRIAELIRSSGGRECTVGYRRGGESLECTLTPVFSEGSYRAGMWVRDSSAGIGTLTFIDPETLTFAGLGHSICDPDTREPLPLSEGTAAEVRIDGVTRSSQGEPGQLLGEFSGCDIGRLTLNCEGGVYGVMDSLPENAAVYPLGYAREVHRGAAYMISQTDGGEPRRYDITIESVSPEGCAHDLIIRTADPALTEQTGGIVQGMSGSPIVQDGRIVGAVTHVFVDDPRGGYGIFAERMYAFAKGA